MIWFVDANFDGLVQDRSNSCALAMELLQSYTKPSIYNLHFGTIKNAHSEYLTVLCC